MKTLHHSDIKFLVVHCSGSCCDRPFTVEGLIATGTARFGQPFYHYYVRRNGAVVAILPESVQGVHAVRFNHCSLAICYEGGLNALGEIQPEAFRLRASINTVTDPHGPVTALVLFINQILCEPSYPSRAGELYSSY